jgi:HSP20 family protein
MEMKSLIPWSWGGYKPARRDQPLDVFQSLHREMDRLFDDFTRGFAMPSEVAGVMTPKVDVAETDKEIEVTAELPGLEEKDVEVVLSDNVLTIRGEKKAEREEKDKGYYLVERSHGAFARSLRLPFDAEPEKVEAAFKNGILTVKVVKPKEVQAKTKKIPIKAAA